MKPRLEIAARLLWGLFCLLGLWVSIGDYLQFKTHPELYPIGSENFGWGYSSSDNYMIMCNVAIGWAVIGIIAAACYRLKYSGIILFLHFMLSIIQIIGYWIFILTL